MDLFKALIPTVIPMDFFIKAKKVKIANIELFNFKAICVTYHRCFKLQWNVTYVNFSPSNKKYKNENFSGLSRQEQSSIWSFYTEIRKFSPKKYFYVKRRGFQEDLALSQISHIKQKMQNLKKNVQKSKSCSLKLKKHNKSKIAHKIRKNIKSKLK